MPSAVWSVPGIVWRADFVGNLLGVPVNFPKPVPSPDVDRQGRVECRWWWQSAGLRR